MSSAAVPASDQKPLGPLREDYFDVFALEPAATGESDGWKISGSRHANLGVGFLHAAFGRGDVRPALEQIRRKARGNCRSGGAAERQRSHIQAGGRRSSEYRDGVLEGGALNVDILI